MHEQAVTNEVRQILSEVANILEVDEFLIYGGFVPDSLLRNNLQPGEVDLDIAIKNTCSTDIHELRARLAKKGFKVDSVIRDYYINLTEKVLTFNASDGFWHFDIGYIAGFDNIGQFNVESMQISFPQLTYVDKHHAMDGIKSKNIALARESTKENPYLLLSRLVYLSSKYDVPLANSEKLLNAMAQETTTFCSTERFHSAIAKATLNSYVLKSIVRNNNKTEFIKALVNCGILEVVSPPLHEALREVTLLPAERLNTVNSKYKLVNLWLSMLSSSHRVFHELIQLRERYWSIEDVRLSQYISAFLDKRPLLSVVVPAYNEEQTIGEVLDRLNTQIIFAGKAINSKLYNILVVVHGKTIDATREIVSHHQRKNVVNVDVIEGVNDGVVAARIEGVNFLMDSDKSTPYLAFCDADLLVSERWIDSLFDNFISKSSDVLSYAGTFPADFWMAVPTLRQKYLDEVGTIFFDRDTISGLEIKGQEFPFTEQLFLDFGRPASGGAYAITRDAYWSVGGYQREFLDRERKIELDGPTWRLLFKLNRNNAAIQYVNDEPFTCSPRRLLGDPYQFFSIKRHDEFSELKEIRTVVDDDFERIESLAPSIDMTAVKRYVVQYYVVLPILNKTRLIQRNAAYFGELFEQIRNSVCDWRESNPDPSSLEVFDFSHTLCEKYFTRLLRHMPLQPVP